MSPSLRFFGFAAAFSAFVAVSGCDHYADRMSVGEQQLSQGKFPQAEEAFLDATTAAEDGESLYRSLKALAGVYEAQGDMEKAQAVRKHAVRVMGHCLDDFAKTKGLLPCPVRETDVPIGPHAGG